MTPREQGYLAAARRRARRRADEGHPSHPLLTHLHARDTHPRTATELAAALGCSRALIASWTRAHAVRSPSASDRAAVERACGFVWPAEIA